MGSDNLEERAEVIFPGPLNEKQFKDLAKYLAKNSVQTQYDAKISREIRKDKAGEISVRKYCSEISGTMKNTKIYANFGCIINGQNFIEGLNFQTILGYPLEKHNWVQVRLWDKVRELTMEYFFSEKK